MRLKLFAATALVAVLGIAPHALAMGGQPYSGTIDGFNISGSCDGSNCSGTFSNGSTNGSFTGTLHVAASEPLTAFAVGLGLLGARYLRRRG